MNRRDISFYTTVDGRCPIKEFLDSLSDKTVQKITWVLKLIQDLEMVPSTYLKKLEATDDIWECRVQFGSQVYRLLGFFVENSLIYPYPRFFEEESEDTEK